MKFYQLSDKCPGFKVTDGPAAGTEIKRGERYPEKVVETLSKADREKMVPWKAPKPTKGNEIPPGPPLEKGGAKKAPSNGDDEKKGGSK